MSWISGLLNRLTVRDRLRACAAKSSAIVAENGLGLVVANILMKPLPELQKIKSVLARDFL